MHVERGISGGEKLGGRGKLLVIWRLHYTTHANAPAASRLLPEGGFSLRLNDISLRADHWTSITGRDNAHR